MVRFTKVNNERSEAIELIKHMDFVVKRNTWQIKSIGGESTLNTGKKRMFPDVFIYGDTARTQILQGWEIKMPNVPITDTAFIQDAQRKADVLGVNSCVIWNFTYAVLYIKDNANNWKKSKVWDGTNHIKKRSDVITYKTDWEVLISIILSELNSFFISGDLISAKLGDIVSETIFTEIIERNKQLVAENLKQKSASQTIISSYIKQWWRVVEKEYKFDETDQFSAYAKYMLINWINKFTFANMIKNNHNPAIIIENIDESIAPTKALSIFEEITSKCDFFNIFEAVPYAEILPNSTWIDLTDYNAFLCENGIDQIPQEALQSVLENSVNQFKRNVSGVFATPQKLAEILVKAGIDDLTAYCIDPCCGIGTIAKEIISTKETVIGIEKATATAYASDKNSFPLQIANISMTRVNSINLPSLLFQSNVFELSEGKEIEIIDPKSGDKKIYILPKFGSITSNLPFVAFDQEGREESNYINAIIESVRNESKINLSGRIDLCQAVLLKLKELLADNASIAVITSNSWLGTLTGQKFFKALNYYYNIETIVASGNGKWFGNADVVTLMLFLKNKSVSENTDSAHIINFGLINKRLDEISADDTGQIVDSIKLKRTIDKDLFSFRKYSIEQISSFLDMNIALNSCFYDIKWLTSIKDILCPVTDLFTVFRGMKTGQDEIFYLKNNADVDSDYVRRIFKSAKSSNYLIAEPDTYSFVCDKTVEELTALGHHKTLQWISRFKEQINQSVPNKETFWNNLSGNKLSGSEPIQLFTGMNPEQRIFYGLLKEPAQINQRAIGFKPLFDSVNLELCHVLLNSVIGILYAEATGFPKGLGALDNRAENTKQILMLDPRRLSADNVNKVIEAFKPLLNRTIMTTIQEYQQVDRLEFERIVAEVYGYVEHFEKIRDTVLEMQRVRLSVKHN